MPRRSFAAAAPLLASLVVAALGGETAAAEAAATDSEALASRYISDNPAHPNRYRGDPFAGIVHEVSLGALRHDLGPFTHQDEERSLDLHVEVRFVSPAFLKGIGRPYPHVGANINTSGQTSQVFAGLSWEWELDGGLFAGFSLGAAVHDGETTKPTLDRKQLGCALLFRESVNIGYRWDDRNGIALLGDHISNANLCRYNEGLENVGVRYQHRF